MKYNASVCYKSKDDCSDERQGQHHQHDAGERKKGAFLVVLPENHGADKAQYGIVNTDGEKPP